MGSLLRFEGAQMGAPVTSAAGSARRHAPLGPHRAAPPPVRSLSPLGLRGGHLAGGAFSFIRKQKNNLCFLFGRRNYYFIYTTEIQETSKDYLKARRMLNIKYISGTRLINMEPVDCGGTRAVKQRVQAGAKNSSIR